MGLDDKKLRLVLEFKEHEDKQPPHKRNNSTKVLLPTKDYISTVVGKGEKPEWIREPGKLYRYTFDEAIKDDEVLFVVAPIDRYNGYFVYRLIIINEGQPNEFRYKVPILLEGVQYVSIEEAKVMTRNEASKPPPLQELQVAMMLVEVWLLAITDDPKKHIKELREEAKKKKKKLRINDTCNRFTQASKLLGWCFDGSVKPYLFPKDSDEFEEVLKMAEGKWCPSRQTPSRWLAPS